jgi:hypothetical protein
VHISFFGKYISPQARHWLPISDGFSAGDNGLVQSPSFTGIVLFSVDKSDPKKQHVCYENKKTPNPLGVLISLFIKIHSMNMAVPSGAHSTSP